MDCSSVSDDRDGLRAIVLGRTLKSTNLVEFSEI